MNKLKTNNKKEKLLMIRQSRKYAVWAALLMLVLSFANTAEAEQPENKQMKINIVLLPTMSYAPFFIAQDEGFSQSRDLTLDI
jgi:ABC-type nitrate/sulfonate/bicarbonate transport system substrate-binding protein